MPEMTTIVVCVENIAMFHITKWT